MCKNLFIGLYCFACTYVGVGKCIALNPTLYSRLILALNPTLGDVVQSIQDLTVHVDTCLDVLSTRLDTLETTMQRICEGDELYGRGHNHG